MLVNCEAPHSGQNRHDSQGDLQRAPATGSWWQPPAVSPESSGCANTRAGGAGASDSLAFATRQLRGRLKQAHTMRQRRWAPEQPVPVEREWGSLCGQEFLAMPRSNCLGTHLSLLYPEGHIPSPACLLHGKEADTSYRKQSPGMCLP